jgi:hypothetical protein
MPRAKPLVLKRRVNIELAQGAIEMIVPVFIAFSGARAEIVFLS